MSRPIDRLLPLLKQVRETGPGRWMACCPSHDDRRPSLSVRELDDGTLLLRCWAGCGTDHVVAAVGLELRDLFSARPDDRRPIRRSQRWIPRDVLAALAQEVTVAALIVDAMVRGDRIRDDDATRLATAAGRLGDASRELSR